MAIASTVKLTIHFTDPDLNPEERDEQAQRLLSQMRDLDDVETDRVLDAHPPEGNKAFASFLPGALLTQMSVTKIKSVFEFLGDRLSGKAIELEVEANGKKLKVRASNPEELRAALQVAQEFITAPASSVDSPVVVPGSTALKPMTSASPAIEVFFSYSHKDEELRDELATHLSMLKRQGMISAWHDREISAGTEWAGAIDAHLNSAQVILLLISANFLASDYCYDKELMRAMERHEAGEARVIPIILKPSDWTSAPFGKLQALPKNAKPITKWEDRDEAFLNVVQEIRKAVTEMGQTGKL
jgi:TIR domain